VLGEDEFFYFQKRNEKESTVREVSKRAWNGGNKQTERLENGLGAVKMSGSVSLCWVRPL
jgi:hypothetical protein